MGRASLKMIDIQLREFIIASVDHLSIPTRKQLVLGISQKKADGWRVLTSGETAVRIRSVPMGESRGIREGAPFLCVAEWRMMQMPKGAEQQPFSAEVVTLEGGNIETIEAESVHIHQGGARTITASEVTLDRGSALSVNGETIHMIQSSALAAHGDDLNLVECNTLSLSGDAIDCRSTRAGIVFANQAKLEDSSALILFSRNINGNVETLLDQRSAALAGILAGAIFGMLFFLGRMFRK